MGAGASGLLLCLLGLVLLRRDLRRIWRQRRWRRARAVPRFEQGSTGPVWHFDFTLPDGRPVRATSGDLRLLARREDGAAMTVLYDPEAPARGIDVPARPGLPAAVGLGLLALGIAQVLR